MPSTAALPHDFAEALRATPGARAAWDRLAPSHRREHLDAIAGAKRADTRARRIAKAMEMLAGGTKRPVTASRKSLAEKLLVRPGQTITVLHAPGDAATLLGTLPDGAVLRTRSAKRARGHVLLFLHDSHELVGRLPAAMDALADDGALWVAYPKQRGGVTSDLNRDWLHELMRAHGWMGVAQVSVDDRWSASRFRPA